ncbi:MAG TPA: NAD(P)/FAD-dependent oxidoreductase [Bryobacteraceae bacterium]|nr:NAD(P)/FAD-dependent oxidoreductase [Bryobacteraceae bacterium]
MDQKTAVIIGAGPAGLTAAFELCTRTDIHPVVLEKSQAVGGLARTVNYKGNRIDIGGHRFFSKSDRVVDWWLRILPLQATGNDAELLTYQNRTRSIYTRLNGLDPDVEDRVMLIRRRLSRIYFRRRFFQYPITPSFDALRNLGMLRVARIGASYLRAVLFPRRERSLEDFFINRFGGELYRTFFKSYTEKVWGVPCDQMSAEWGAQRVKGLSISRALRSAVRRMWRRPAASGDVLAQKQTETSLIQKFLYPKYGPGQMWEEVAGRVTRDGGEILAGWSAERVEQAGNRRITAIWARHSPSGELRRFPGDFFFSTMPVKELVGAMTPEAPPEIRAVAAGLVYRDFIIVGVLCSRLKAADGSGRPIQDNWIYIHEPDVLAGRLQIFNNWSPYMVSDSSKTWIGLEYFCGERDPLWRRPDEEMIALARRELAVMNIADPNDCLDATVIRMPKAYPAYFGSYDQFPRIIEWADRFENLFLIGRNGMHRYNNQDHSMLAAMTAVDNLVAGITSRENLWSLNTEMEHHEEPQAAAAQASR